MSTISLSEVASRTPEVQLAHDLRGPLVTIEGFQGEMSHALDELERMLTDGEKSSEIAERLASLLDEDLRPCLAFAGRALGQMHERIDELDPPSEGEPP